MRSFEHGYLLETPISHELLMAVRAVGEFRGRQTPPNGDGSLGPIPASASKFAACAPSTPT